MLAKGKMIVYKARIHVTMMTRMHKIQTVPHQHTQKTLLLDLNIQADIKCMFKHILGNFLLIQAELVNALSSTFFKNFLLIQAEPVTHIFNRTPQSPKN